MNFSKIANLSLSAVFGLTFSIGMAVDAQALDGAKDMFAGQLNAADGSIKNIGLSYSIELRRQGKLYKVDNRFPFRSGDQIRFHVRPNVDGFMYIVLDDEQGGSPNLMFPRAGDDKNAVVKGRSFTIPENGMLTFDNDAGVEALKLVLSAKTLDQKLDHSRRTIVIHAKKDSQKLPSDFFIDFSAIDPAAPLTIPDGSAVTAQDFESQPALTMVTTAADKPLVVDLLLRHQANDTSGPSVASSGNDRTSRLARTQQIITADKPNQKVKNILSGSSPVADKWAVVIGISQFKNPRWNLNFPDKDATDFAKFLTQKCNFAADHVKVLTNSAATRERIMTDVGSQWLPQNAKPNDLVCIYIATHGTSTALDVAHRNFLMAYDTDPTNPFATGIELQDLAKNVVRRLQSKRVVLILDTCHSGAAETGSKGMPVANPLNMADLLQGTGHLIIASAAANQTAHDSTRYKNGIFTKHLIDGLSKHTKLTEAFNYASLRVQDESTRDFKEPQTPILKDAEWKGVELKLGVPPSEPRKPVTK